MKKSPFFSVPIPGLSLNKLGLVVGSLVIGEWAINDLVHIPSGGLAVLVLGAGAWAFSNSSKGKFSSPSTVRGWIDRCHEVLDQFESLEGNQEFSENQLVRKTALGNILDKEGPQTLSLVSTSGIELPETIDFAEAISPSIPLEISLSSSLPLHDKNWKFPNHLVEKDSLIYFLPLPLRAVDLLWLEQIPQEQPCWIMAYSDSSISWPQQQKALISQLPQRWTNRILKWSSSDQNIREVLNPVRRSLENSNQIKDLTVQRLLSRLHSSWQSDLEFLRRDKFREIQNRSQWLVAGAVFASPVPSTDLLSVAVVNGLMIQEMGSIWSCKLEPELLKAVARQLALAALAQGVVEWSGQALLGVAKLHGGAWLAAGTMQALSAAYLTRVVGRSMADWMALNNGVTKLDLDLLKVQAGELVSKAADSEKVDWKSFIQQANSWMTDQLTDQQPKLDFN